MDLKSGYPWWAVKNGLMHEFPALQSDLDCEIAVLGGGITGALIADEMQRAGFDVAVLEQRDIAWGSTAASTALLQYEIDTHLIDLARRYGEADAGLAYTACAEAIEQLRDVTRGLRDVGFFRNDSLYVASRWRDARTLAEEQQARQRWGLDVAFLAMPEMQREYGLSVPAALVSRQAACVDPYRMAQRLFQRLHKQGARVHDRTRVDRVSATRRRVELVTEHGHRVRAQYLIVAGGYASQAWLKQKVARNRSSYAFITDPLDPDELGWLKHTVVWESARPYLYIRATPDHRLLVGGEDDAIDIPARRDARVMRKAMRLAGKAHGWFPHLPLRPAFAWAGTFAETEDGLPFFGPHPQYGPRVHFAMAYGGNGITYSMIGAGLLRARIERRRHPLARLFSFERLDTRR